MSFDSLQSMYTVPVIRVPNVFKSKSDSKINDSKAELIEIEETNKKTRKISLASLKNSYSKLES